MVLDVVSSIPGVKFGATWLAVAWAYEATGLADGKKWTRGNILQYPFLLWQEFEDFVTVTIATILIRRWM